MALFNSRRKDMLTLYAALLPAHLAEANKVEMTTRRLALDDAMTNAWSQAAEALYRFNRMENAARV